MTGKLIQMSNQLSAASLAMSLGFMQWGAKKVYLREGSSSHQQPSVTPNPTQPTLARADTNVKCTASSSSGAGLVVCFLSNCYDCPQLRYRDLNSLMSDWLG